MKDFLQISKERYTTKHYDSSKKISNADFQKLLEILRLAPSAVNVQPWFFYTGSSKEAKDTIIKAIPEFNIPRIQGCSHFVVLCAKTKLEDEYLRSVTAKESADGRYSEDRIRDAVDEHRRLFSNMHVEFGDFNEWTARQTYIAMAALLYGAASMGIDSTPIEGMDYSKCDEILNLKEKNLRSVAIVTLGYRASDDSNASRPKSRLELEDIVQNID
ncbi:MAG: oxygen-insensitive NAD(P)H nitroreductase [Succinatimonas hippei]|nr:oxygen-insensitive NAD(P)H nitroreductase [Succinatimonas hippei]